MCSESLFGFYLILTHFNTGSITLLWFFYDVVVNVVYCGGMELTIGGGKAHGRIGLTSFLLAYVPN